MPLQLPIIYPITSGATTAQTTPEDPQFLRILRLVQAAIDADIPFFQIREKSMDEQVLYELTTRAVKLTRGSNTRVLVNGRFDIALDTGADGAHLNVGTFLEILPQIQDSDFIVGISAHAEIEVEVADVLGARFAVFGPVFDTESKRQYGPPQGLTKLHSVAGDYEIPVLAIGGITLDNVAACFKAKASGVAAIRLLNNAEKLPEIAAEIRNRFAEI
jgi:thiamine-phosphate pyrophosphorylase